MYKIIAAIAAKRDLEEIKDYLLGVLCNPQAVSNLERQILRAYDTLQITPNAFPECRRLALRRKGYRLCVLGAYLFVYEVIEDDQIVKIHRFFHSSQDWENYL